MGQERLNTDLAGDSAAAQSTSAPRQMEVKTSWWQIDDVFYEARGASWALLHFLKAVEIDFAATLQKKNAQMSLKQIIRELEATQETVWSPMILNGSGFGMLANHSLVMANYIFPCECRDNRFEQVIGAGLIMKKGCLFTLLIGASMASGVVHSATLFQVDLGIKGADISGSGKYGDTQAAQISMPTENATYTEVYVTVEHPLPLIPNVKLASANAEFSGQVTLAQTYSLGGQLYSVASNLSTMSEQSHQDIIAYYEFFDNSFVRIRPRGKFPLSRRCLFSIRVC